MPKKKEEKKTFFEKISNNVQFVINFQFIIDWIGLDCIFVWMRKSKKKEGRGGEMRDSLNDVSCTLKCTL